ncbi:MAG: hypothetical protein AAGA21_16295 [Pseudomonadota bacterium]
MTISKSDAPTSRRALLVTSAAAAGTGLLAASTTTETAEAAVVDPHPAWLGRWQAISRDCWDARRIFQREQFVQNSQILSWKDVEEARDWEDFRLERLIATTPAKTPQGARSQLELLSEASGGLRCARSRYEPELAASVMAFLEAQEG